MEAPGIEANADCLPGSPRKAGKITRSAISVRAARLGGFRPSPTGDAGRPAVACNGRATVVRSREDVAGSVRDDVLDGLHFVFAEARTQERIHPFLTVALVDAVKVPDDNLRDELAVSGDAHRVGIDPWKSPQPLL